MVIKKLYLHQQHYLIKNLQKNKQILSSKNHNPLHNQIIRIDVFYLPNQKPEIFI